MIMMINIMLKTKIVLHQIEHEMGVSENSVPLNPMVNDYYPY